MHWHKTLYSRQKGDFTLQHIFGLPWYFCGKRTGREGERLADLQGVVRLVETPQNIKGSF